MEKSQGEKEAPKRSPLYEMHASAGARFIDFNGWEMPLQFSGIIEEHLAVRNSVGLFDISHMGEIEVTGPEALDCLQHVLTNDLSKLRDGEAQYTVMCYENGGIVDDLVVYRINRDNYLLCVNAANTEKDFRWMNENRKKQAAIVDKTMELALLAIQGPFSQATLQPLVQQDLGSLKKFSFAPDKPMGINALISRTGYTGEDGFEIFLPAKYCHQLWNELMTAGGKYGIRPAGLGARDTLRLEMGYPLYGHEINEDTNPYEAGIGWVVKLEKGDFLGKSSLRDAKTKGCERSLVCLEMVDKGIARRGYEISSGGRVVGYITSGTMSPSLRVPIAMGYISSELAKEGTFVEVDIKSRKRSARVVKRPFYKGGH